MSSTHVRNTAGMHAAPRCGAKTRRQTACMAPAISGHRRCRMHGGKGSGAPPGNTNALKHGEYSKESVTLRGEARLLLRQINGLIALDKRKKP